MGSAFAALLGTSVYYLAFLMFRHAALRMPPLRGSRPFRAAGYMLTDWIWMLGGVMLFVGLAYEVIAFAELPLSVAQPIFALSLVFLLAYATSFLGERLSRREWASVALFGAATVLVGLSSGRDPARLPSASTPPVFELALVTIPPIMVAGLVWLVGDRTSGGRHARPLAGVAYGIGAGVCAGVAEAGVRGIAAVWIADGTVEAVIRSPYPYLTLLMAGISLLQVQIALQRCRISIVATIITVIGRTMLVVTSTVLFDDTWPDRPVPLALRLTGFSLAILAIVLFPRHEHPHSAIPYAPRRRKGPAATARRAA
ncbi:hypothetical protein GCM10010468_05220 [Actinocorallia longicatena]|uniref:Magnesium transporter NIPA n=1 Tax=Actinocorallia longicatena TaxID=111803 RepID=A0ABP6PXX7_9ACTN